MPAGGGVRGLGGAGLGKGAGPEAGTGRSPGSGAWLGQGGSGTGPQAPRTVAVVLDEEGAGPCLLPLPGQMHQAPAQRGQRPGVAHGSEELQQVWPEDLRGAPGTSQGCVRMGDSLRGPTQQALQRPGRLARWVAPEHPAQFRKR